MSDEAKELSHDEKFISYLERLKRDDDRGALAQLRRGLGKPPGTAIEMYPYISRWTSSVFNREADAYFLIASLFGLYPTSSWKAEDEYNNLGKSLSLMKDDSGSIEKRFTALLNADEEDLPDYLRQIVSLIKAREKPINWHLLLEGVRQWGRSDRGVQRQWARGFWGNPEKPDEKLDTNNEGGDA
jgi:CRISPR system Cascade subunit CasB